MQVKKICVSSGVTEVFTSSIMSLKFLSCLFGGANVADARERTPKCGAPTKQTDWTIIGAKSAFFVGKQLPLPVSLCFTIITVSTSSTLATHRGQTSALTGTWTDSQTHLDNHFQ